MWAEGKRQGPKVRNIALVSCSVSADGPDEVLLSTSPSIFKGVLSAKIGSQVDMACTAFSVPSPKYHWSHNGSLLSFSDASITLPSLAWEQMGRYRCIVDNPVTQLTMYREFQIQTPREYSSSPLGLMLPKSSPPNAFIF